jgi:hypothetical protein
MGTSEHLQQVGSGTRRAVASAAGLTPSRELVRDVLRDRDVRASARRALKRAARLRRKLSRSEGLGRLARDRRLQKDMAAIVRSAAAALDASSVASRRRPRRRALRFALLTGALASLAARIGSRALNGRSPEHLPADGGDVVTETSPGSAR